MTKISSYVTDDLITGGDKWIGSDVSNSYRTKNFTPSKLASYFNDNQIINIGADLQYTYYTLEPGEGRPEGTLTFEAELGSTVNFSSITTFLLSKYTTKQNDVSNFFNFVVGSRILLYKSLNINSFGYYIVNSISPYILDGNFYKVVVSYISGNGYIQEDNDYMISVVDKSTGGGSNTFLNNITVSLTGNKTLGKYTTGQTIPSANKTFEEVMNDIAIEYLPPVFTSFFMSSQSTTLESGTIMSGTRAFTFSLSNSGNITPNTLGIYYGSTALATGLAVSSPVSVSVGTVNLTGNGTVYSWSAKATNTLSVVFTSNIYTITSRYYQFYGNVTNIPTNSAEVRSFASNLLFANVNSWVTPTITTNKFSLSIPAIKSLTTVITANFENITSSFVLTTFDVNDAGGNAISYKTYAYSSTIPLNLTVTITVA